jgi:hypothetical protein
MYKQSEESCPYLEYKGADPPETPRRVAGECYDRLPIRRALVAAELYSRFIRLWPRIPVPAHFSVLGRWREIRTVLVAGPARCPLANNFEEKKHE